MASWYRPDPLTRDLIHLINARRHDHSDAELAIDVLQAALAETTDEAARAEILDSLGELQP